MSVTFHLFWKRRLNTECPILWTSASSMHLSLSQWFIAECKIRICREFADRRQQQQATGWIIPHNQFMCGGRGCTQYAQPNVLINDKFIMFNFVLRNGSKPTEFFRMSANISIQIKEWVQAIINNYQKHLYLYHTTLGQKYCCFIAVVVIGSVEGSRK